MPLPSARALCCIYLRQDAASIANGIALRALEPRLSQENGRKGSEGCARFLPGRARRNRLVLCFARSAFGTCSGSRAWRKNKIQKGEKGLISACVTKHLSLKSIIISRYFMPLPAARALCCICLWQDAASIANGIALRALGAEAFPRKR